MIEKFDSKHIIILLLSALACVDFMGLGVYIMSLIMIICLLLYSKFFYKCICNRCFFRFFLMCFLSTLLYCVQTNSFNRTFVASVLIMPVSMYIAGYCLIESFGDTKKYLIKTVLILSSVTAGYGFVTAMNKGDLSAYSAYSDAYINNLMRTSYSIWNHNPIAGTVLSPLFVLIIAVAAYSLIYLRGISRVLLAVFILLGIEGSLILGSRANIVILLFCLFTVLICFFSTLNGKQILLKRLLLLSMLVVVAFVLNIGEIQDKVFNSTLFYRLSMMDTSNSSSLFAADGRLDIVNNYLSQLSSHPFGGISIDTGHSAHNTILQYGAFGGILGLILALWFYVPFLVSLIKYSWSDCSESKILFMPIVTSIILLFMVESISISNSIVYSLFVMILVMIRQYYIKERFKYEYKTDNN